MYYVKKLIPIVFFTLVLTGCAHEVTEEEVLREWQNKSGLLTDVEVLDSWSDSFNNWTTVKNGVDVVHLRWDEEEGLQNAYPLTIYSSHGVPRDVVDKLVPGLTDKVLNDFGGGRFVNVISVEDNLATVDIDGMINIFEISADEKTDGLYVEGWETVKSTHSISVDWAPSCDGLHEGVKSALDACIRKHCEKYEISGDITVMSLEPDACVLSVNDDHKALKLRYLGESEDILELKVSGFIRDALIGEPWVKELVESGKDVQKGGYADFNAWECDWRVVDGIPVFRWNDAYGNIISKDFVLTWNTECADKDFYDWNIREYLSAHGMEGDVNVVSVESDFVTLVIDGVERRLRCIEGTNAPDTDEEKLYLDRNKF